MDFSRLKGVPRHIGHTFACDYVERAFLLKRETKTKLLRGSWEALSAKRLFLNGKISKMELREMTVALEASYERAMQKILGEPSKRWDLAWKPEQAALAAVSKGGQSGVKEAIRLAEEACVFFSSALAKEEYNARTIQYHMRTEESWQRQHLAWLLLDYFWRPFCEAVMYVAMENHEQLESYYQELETALF